MRPLMLVEALRIQKKSNTAVYACIQGYVCMQKGLTLVGAVVAPVGALVGSAVGACQASHTTYQHNDAR